MKGGLLPIIQLLHISQDVVCFFLMTLNISEPRTAQRKSVIGLYKTWMCINL